MLSLRLEAGLGRTLQIFIGEMSLQTFPFITFYVRFPVKCFLFGETKYLPTKKNVNN